jgi:DNA polymerase-3 subunit delta'
MLFQSVPGLAPVKEKLLRAAHSGKVPHAQLFMGPPGALTLPLALAYATYLHCENKSAADACGTCAACAKSLKYIHPDTWFVFPAGNVKGDKDDERHRADLLKSWRRFLLQQPFGDMADWANVYGGEDKQALISREESREIIRTLSLKSFESPYKVMVVWQPEYMHAGAANGILKILEEPPPNTFFLLVSNDAGRLLPTIRSRVQTTPVPLLADADVENFLKNHFPHVAGTAAFVHLAEGHLRAAMALAEGGESSLHDAFAAWMRACYKADYAQLVPLAETFHDMDRLQQNGWMTYALSMLRESLVRLSGAEKVQRLTGAERDFVANFSKVLTVAHIDRIQQHVADAAYFLERNGSAKMIFLDLSIRIARVLKPVGI